MMGAPAGPNTNTSTMAVHRREGEPLQYAVVFWTGIESPVLDMSVESLASTESGLPKRGTAHGAARRRHSCDAVAGVTPRFAAYMMLTSVSPRKPMEVESVASHNSTLPTRVQENALCFALRSSPRRKPMKRGGACALAEAAEPSSPRRNQVRVMLLPNGLRLSCGADTSRPR